MCGALLLLSLFGVNLDGCGIKNDRSGRCTAACIETAARANGVKKLEGFFSRGPTPGYTVQIEAALKKEGVDYLMTKDYSYDREPLKGYAESHGVIVTILKGATWIDFQGEHSILVTEYGEEDVVYYDPNRHTKLWKVSRKEFDKYWAGNAIVVLPPPPAPAAAPRVYIDADKVFNILK